jgi:CheY-like chemotaxis protein
MQKNTILWADDDADDLQMMREILLKNNKDYKIIEVNNGKEALNFLSNIEEAQYPSLIILDINMPVLDGKETLSILKKEKKYQQIPVVVFTTSESQLDKIFCKKFGTEMITKPPNFKNLESAVVKLLDYCSTN